MKTPTAKMMSVMASVLSLTGGAQAFWRMPCRSRTGLARIDPIMTPGEVADHVHAIHGGNSESSSSHVSLVVRALISSQI